MSPCFAYFLLERSEYKLYWAQKPYFSHVHIFLGTITPSNKHVSLFSNDFKCTQVSQMIQWILSHDNQYRHISNTKYYWGLCCSQLKHALLVYKIQWPQVSQPSFQLISVIVLLPKTSAICHLSISGWHNSK